MSEFGLTEQDWQVILGTIQERRCTPFLGAGVNYGLLPMGAKIANDWSTTHGYPFLSRDDLASVAQFLAIKFGAGSYPKTSILKILKAAGRPDFTAVADERLSCLRALAELPIPVYLTTNYDDFLSAMLKAVGKSPEREICRWHSGLRKVPTAFDKGYLPTEINPLVYHLHGSDEDLHSLVLTEDDYIDFLVNISRDQRLLPPRVQEALTTASVLFIGYRLRDINFRVIYRGLVESMDRGQRELSITVQITPPDDHAGNPTEARAFLKQYFSELKVRVYWGTASKFADDLRRLWEQYPW